MKISIIKNSRFISSLKLISVLVFWLVIWYIAYFVVNNELLVVSPQKTLFTIINLLKEITFWKIIGLSMFRILCGFLLANIVGIILAVLMVRFKILYDLLNPLLIAIKTTPVASFTVLTLVFIKSSYVPVFISFLMVLPIIWSNVFKGIKKVDVKLLDVAKVFNLNKFIKLNKIYIPSVMPYFLSAFTVGLGFAWKSGIAAEIIANTRLSIGSQIYNAKIYLDTENLFALTIIMIIFSLLLEKIITILMKSITDINVNT